VHKLTLHCNHRSGHFKTEHTESHFLLRCHLENWPRSKHEQRTAGSARETWTVTAAFGVLCAYASLEMHLFLAFEIALFFTDTNQCVKQFVQNKTDHIM
jgi:hypothetical protein